MGIGQIIKMLMKRDKLSAPVLAKKLGKSDQTVRDMLGKDDIHTSVLRDLAVIFNVPISIFFEDKETINSISINGNNNALAGIGNGKTRIKQSNNASSEEAKDQEIIHLKNLLDEKERLIGEKERLINILMNNK